MIFTDTEMARRARTIADGLAAQEVDVAILTTADNVFYATGAPLLSAWGRPMWALVWATGRVALIGAELERETVLEATAEIKRTYDDAENVWQRSLAIVVELLENSEVRRLGIERPFLTVELDEKLAEALPTAERVDVSEVLFGARIVKSAEEISLLRLGGQLAKAGAEVFLDALSDGVTELEVASEAVRAMDRALGDLRPDGASSTYAYCHFGEHTLTPHRHPTGRRLRKGDLVALNVFPVVSGYCIELERTLVFGEPTAEQAQAHSAVTDAFDRAKSSYAVGTRLADIDAEATAMLSAAGYGEYIRHGTGHAHGIMIGQASREDAGELRPYSATLIEPGMANSIEPGVYVPGLGGFRHSDVLIATDAGAELLTEFPVTLSID